MSIMPPPLSNNISGAADWSAFRLSLDQYHAMIDAGILSKEDRVELIDGYLVEKMAFKPPHVFWTRRLRRALERLSDGRNCYVGDGPISFGSSEPEPDLAVLRGADTDHPDRHSSAAETLLVVEVADSSLPGDRGWKKDLYARAGIPVYWIMNVNEVQLEVYWAPVGGEYTASHKYSKDDAVSIVIDGVEIGTIALAEISK